MTPTRRLVIEKAQLDANYPKDLLMAMVHRLDEAGATRHAKSLDLITLRLEAWQNRK